MIEYLRNKFRGVFNQEPELIYFAPGRVNIIGEHIDYNGGLVLPFAMNFGTYVLLNTRDDNQVVYTSTNFDYSGECSLDEFPTSESEWVKYPMGVFSVMSKEFFPSSGNNLLYSGDIPIGSGLSSSASIEVVTAYMLNDNKSCGLSLIEIAKACQAAENGYVGVNCGIMDQYAVAMGKQDRALLIDCDKLDHKEIKAYLGEYKFLVTNTNKPRKLIESKYNERRAECEKALKIIKTRKEVKNLCELTSEDLKLYNYLLKNDVLSRRVKHVVKENERVIETAKALEKSDLTTVGSMMNDSHDSLRDDYEVTGVELDTLVDEARKIDGVLGSRMTGAGFGGCTISLVHKESIELFKEEVGKAYFEKTGLKADFYETEMCDGVRKIE